MHGRVARRDSLCDTSFSKTAKNGRLHHLSYQTTAYTPPKHL